MRELFGHGDRPQDWDHRGGDPRAALVACRRRQAPLGGTPLLRAHGKIRRKAPARPVAFEGRPTPFHPAAARLCRAAASAGRGRVVLLGRRGGGEERGAPWRSSFPCPPPPGSCPSPGTGSSAELGGDQRRPSGPVGTVRRTRGDSSAEAPGSFSSPAASKAEASQPRAGLSSQRRPGSGASIEAGTQELRPAKLSDAGLLRTRKREGRRGSYAWPAVPRAPAGRRAAADPRPPTTARASLGRKARSTPACPPS